MAKIVELFGAGRGAKPDAGDAPRADAVRAFLGGYSIEVTPRALAGVQDLGALLPQNTRVYVAHIAGTPMEDMLGAVRRLSENGYRAMPHFPARVFADAAELERWISAYADFGARQALLLAGGLDAPAGAFENSMQLLETGLFDRYGFTRLHVAGHPEGNRDIDPDGSDRNVMQALKWKQAFRERTDADMAIATQFCFEADPVIAWAERLRAEGVGLPVHIGVAGPAKLQTLIKFAIACGVGPSLRVLKRRAMDMSRLLLPFEPTDFVGALAARKAAQPDFAIEQVHFFPLGGVARCAEWANEMCANGEAGSSQQRA